MAERLNLNKSARWPDPNAESSVVLRALVEIAKRQFDNIIVLENRLNEYENRIEKLEQANKDGQRPPIRYSNALEDVN